MGFFFLHRFISTYFSSFKFGNVIHIFPSFSQIWECHPNFTFLFPNYFFSKNSSPFFPPSNLFSKKFPSHSRSQIFPLDALWTLVGWPKLTPGDPGVTWCDPGWPKVGLKVTQGWLYFSLFFSILILSPFFPVLLHFSVFSCLPHVSPISSFFTHFDCVPRANIIWRKCYYEPMILW